jgi:spore coat polysaccharide biosynthesis protein SpsF (cytidylyltransferase family)
MSDILFLIQARLQSKRLPQKVLYPLCGRPLLEWVRCAIPKNHDYQFLVPEGDENLSLREYLTKRQYPWSSGSERNVFMRFLSAVKTSNHTYIARITADNPMVKCEDFLTSMLDLMKKDDLDYCISSNLPLGCTFEIFTRESFLNQSSKEISPEQIEHVTPEYYRPGTKYRWKALDCGYSHLKHIRVTIDTECDHQMVEELCKILGKTPDEVLLKDLESLAAEKHSVLDINSDIKQKSYQDLE